MVWLLPPHSPTGVWAQRPPFAGGRCIYRIEGLLMKANVYIDGFNLYYGSLRKTSFKWLNLLILCQNLLPGRTIGKIRYFTARIKSLPHDPQSPARQQEYLMALGTIANLEIHYGHFVSRSQNWPVYPLTYPVPGQPPRMTQILRMEEKRSDVNLATLLIMDCVDDDFDEAVVISNDSDLTLPIEYAVKRFGKTVGVINPQRYGKPSRELSQAASWSYREINRSVLAASQFPDVVVAGRARIRKPPSW